jgi:hypothetical protein
MKSSSKTLEAFKFSGGLPIRESGVVILSEYLLDNSLFLLIYKKYYKNVPEGYIYRG